MDFKNRHPLNAIDGYESLSMLEALIPFVDYSLKLPLALFLKFSETRLILKCFQSTENLIHLGLHNPCGDPWDMICSFTGISPDMLKMMFSMMDGSGNSMFSDMFQTMQSGCKEHENYTPNYTGCHGDKHTQCTSSDDFDKNIQQLLAEYDLAQAEQYDSCNQHNDMDDAETRNDTSSQYRY